MTKEEIEAIAARVRAATPGPWFAPISTEVVCDKGIVFDVLAGLAPSEADQGFIVAARTDIETLVEEVKKLYAVIASVHAEALEHAPPIAEYLGDELGERVSIDYWR